MKDAQEFAHLFAQGDQIIPFSEVCRIVDQIDFATFYNGLNPERFHNNFFYEFLPIKIVCQFIGNVRSVQYTGMVNERYDAKIYLDDGCDVIIECTTAIDHEQNLARREISRRDNDDNMLNEWGDCSINWGAPIKWSGNPGNRRIKKFVTHPYPVEIGEFAILKLVSKAMYDKMVTWNWAPGSSHPDWLIIVFQSSLFEDREFYGEILALLASRIFGYRNLRLFMVSIPPFECVLDCNMPEIQSKVVAMSGGRRWAS